jgi:hypothetical protein
LIPLGQYGDKRGRPVTVFLAGFYNAIKTLVHTGGVGISQAFRPRKELIEVRSIVADLCSGLCGQDIAKVFSQFTRQLRGSLANLRKAMSRLVF